MKELSCVVALVVALLATPAIAGIADSPLPELVAGKKTLHLYSVSGVGGTVIAGCATYFSCTSTDTASMQVGIEVFGGAGGGPVNDATATSVSVPPGGSVMFGTGSAVAISIDSNLGTGPVRGSARILSTSKKLICTAFLADRDNAPPTSMVYLTIVKKVNQKGE
jgi:hypothetical protein